MIRAFVDGSAGTTGLKIRERLEARNDVVLVPIDDNYRKDVDAKKEILRQCDVVFLCLPDEAAKESVQMAREIGVRIIDTSTAHRTNKNFTYGFAEIGHYTQIAKADAVAVPGCHATGIISLLFPLIKSEIIKPDYPVSFFSLTGYSGGGKPMIAQYEQDNRQSRYDSPCCYALSQQHKHIPEIMHITGLQRVPIFSPIVADFYSGMLVSLSLHPEFLAKGTTRESLTSLYSKFYKDRPLISVTDTNGDSESGVMAANRLSGYDNLIITVLGNSESITAMAQFDNLGKGASGAAVQCMNIMFSIEETKGLLLSI